MLVRTNVDFKVENADSRVWKLKHSTQLCRDAVLSVRSSAQHENLWSRLKSSWLFSQLLQL